VFLPAASAAANQTQLKPALSTTACALGRISFDSLAAAATDRNFTAILFGDCTGSWKSASAGGGGSAAPHAFHANAVQMGTAKLGPATRIGGTLRLPVFVRNVSPKALDIELTYDARLTAASIDPPQPSGRTLVFNVVRPGVLRIALASANPIPPATGALLFVNLTPGALSNPKPPKIVSAAADDRPLAIE
jgi:hypothetical protein